LSLRLQKRLLVVHLDWQNCHDLQKSKKAAYLGLVLSFVVAIEAKPYHHFAVAH